MQDRKTVIAVFLSILVIIIYSEAFLAPPRPTAERQSEDVSGSATEGARPATQEPSAPRASTTPSQLITEERSDSAQQPQTVQTETRSLEEMVEGGVLVISHPAARAEVSLVGGALLSYRLRGIRATLGTEEDLDLVSLPDAPTLFPLTLRSGNWVDSGVTYTLAGFSDGVRSNSTNTEFFVEEGQRLRLRLRADLPDGREIEKFIQFDGGNYRFLAEAKLSAPFADGSPVELLWPTFIPTEVQVRMPEPFAFVSLLASNSLERNNVSPDGGNSSREHLTRWSGFGEKYFMAAFLAPPGRTLDVINAQLGPELFLLASVGDSTELRTDIFAGPKKYTLLRSFDIDLQRAINFGFLTVLAQPLLMLLHYLYEGFLFLPGIGNYGLAIIALTLIIKTLFLPLTKVSMKSMAKMQEVQPEIKALRERIKDPTQLNQEMLALYKKRGVNPAAGCLPIIIQIPVFFGLYMALLNSFELRHAPFALWVQDLSAPESLQVLGIGVPVMLLLMGASMYLQQLTMPSTLDPLQKRIMMLMPIVFTGMFIFIPIPAGLVLYWLVNNLISIVQQAVLRSDKKASPLQATLLASALIFGIGYVVALL